MNRTRFLPAMICSALLWSSVAPILARPPHTPRLLQAADALSFSGTDAYVTFGQANALGLSAFTIETWLRRAGTGQAAFTGNGGLRAIPLVTKGRGEDDGSRVDMNYFLGLDETRNVLVADFQDLANGGDGWLRWLQFSPANNRIRVKTYSPILDLYDENPASQFNLSYNMENSGFGQLGTKGHFASGSTTTFRWAGLRPNTEYEWYITVSDGLSSVTSARWRFRTGAS